MAHMQPRCKLLVQLVLEVNQMQATQHYCSQTLNAPFLSFQAVLGFNFCPARMS